MDILIGAVLLIAVLWALLSGIYQLSVTFSRYCLELFVSNEYIIGAIICFIASYFAFVYLRPHKMEKLFLYYKAGVIDFNEFSKRFSSCGYNLAHGLPWYHSSAGMAKRIYALNRRIDEEIQATQKAKEYIINREMNK